MDDDFNYVFIAPAVQWRGGRFYLANGNGFAADYTMGHAEPATTHVTVTHGKTKRKPKASVLSFFKRGK